MWPSLIENWPNEFLFYRQNLNKPEGFTMDEQKKMFTDRHGTLDDALASRIAYNILIRTEITSFACTPPTQIFVAKFLQYGNIFLCGLDFAYVDDKERFTDYQNVFGKWVKNEHPLNLQRDPPYVETSNGLKTDPLHLYYKKNFLSACRMSEGMIYTTDKGAITEIPYIDIDHVVKHQGKKIKPIDNGMRNRNYERYLATQNCFCIVYEHGMSFVEVQDPLRDIEGYCHEQNKRYICTSCNAAMTKSDYADGTGGECPNCKKKALRRANPIDVTANMKRVKALVDYVKETA
jgi:DNA-directed RNA polymerase subunit RPC12/RpoP